MTDRMPRDSARGHEPRNDEARDHEPWTGQGPVITNPPSPHEPYGRSPRQRPHAAHRARRSVGPFLWMVIIIAVLALIALVIVGITLAL